MLLGEGRIVKLRIPVVLFDKVVDDCTGLGIGVNDCIAGATTSTYLPEDKVIVVRVNHGRRAAVRVEQDIRLLFELRVLDRSVFVGQIELLNNQRHFPRIRSRSKLVDNDGLEVRHGAKCEWEGGLVTCLRFLIVPGT